MNDSFVQAEKALADLWAMICKGWRIKSDPARERRLRKACEAAKLINEVRLGARTYCAVPRHPASFRHLTDFWLCSLESLAEKAFDTSLDLITAVKASDWLRARELAGDAGGQVGVARTFYGLLYHGEKIFAEQEAARLDAEARQ